MTTFYSVDVETSGTDPFKYDLLSVGVVVVWGNGLIGPTFYRRLKHGFDSEVVWDPETKAWWLEQNVLAKKEIFSTEVERHDAGVVAAELAQFVLDTGGEEPHGRVFVANPVAFDHAWIRKLFSEEDVENPFSYRSLCLRSAGWGAGSVGWQERERIHKPFVEHHALHDAQAQALDLLDLLKGRQ